MQKPKRDLVDAFRHAEESFDFDDPAYCFENDHGDRAIPNALYSELISADCMDPADLYELRLGE